MAQTRHSLLLLGLAVLLIAASTIACSMPLKTGMPVTSGFPVTSGQNPDPIGSNVEQPVLAPAAQQIVAAQPPIEAQQQPVEAQEQPPVVVEAAVQQELPEESSSGAMPTVVIAEPTQAATATPLPALSLPPGCQGSGDEATEDALLKLVNDTRLSYGLNALTMNSQLRAAARGHSVDMACNNFFGHVGSGSSQFSDRVTLSGYVFSYLGETLYAGSSYLNTPENAVQGWLNSPGHRVILLGANFTDIGLGYVFNPDSTYGGYYTADYGSP